MKFKWPKPGQDLLAAALGILLIIGGLYYGYRTYSNLEKDKTSLAEELEQAREINLSLINTLREREGTIQSFQDQIGSISSTVGTLEKLSQTDEELLKKYSKVYFLNENYYPARLTEIDKEFLYPGSTNTMIHTDVWPHLRELLISARNNGIDLLAASAFRSFQAQSSLKSAYTVTYGTGANRFSADQGYSEHQLGTALDFGTTKSGAANDKFATDPAYKWLENNAYRYGFILSYPKNNAYYKYEPWHWRYVGVKLATRLHDDGKYFYDLDQREIDQYLVDLF